MALVKGLETVPVKEIEYNGMNLRELDLDGVIKRHPQLVLVMSWLIPTAWDAGIKRDTRMWKKS